MSVELHFNGQRTNVTPGQSLFDCAETLGIKVPTSCQKNGKCKECVVEVIEGMELLSAPALAENHLRDRFRLSRLKPTSVRRQVGRRPLSLTSCASGDMRIERSSSVTTDLNTGQKLAT